MNARVRAYLAELWDAVPQEARDGLYLAIGMLVLLAIARFV